MKSSDYSLFTLCSFYSNKSKHDFYRVKEYVSNFCANVKEHVTDIIRKRKCYFLQRNKTENTKNKNLYAKNNLMICLLR